MSSATFETSLTHQKRRAGTDTIYLFIVMLHATTRNLNCFTNNHIFYILKLHLHWELSLKVSPRGY